MMVEAVFPIGLRDFFRSYGPPSRGAKILFRRIDNIGFYVNFLGKLSKKAVIFAMVEICGEIFPFFRERKADFVWALGILIE